MIDRRNLLRSAIGGAAAVAAGPVGYSARADNTLEKLSLFVPAAPGGGWDQTARAIERTLKLAGLARRIEVVNAPGQRGVTGLTRFATEMSGQGDSLMVTGLVMISATAGANAPITLANVTALARLAADFQIVVVPAASKLQSFSDLAVALTSDAGAVEWTGGPVGGTDHILAGLISRAVGIDLARLRYRAAPDGEPIQAALLDGRAAVGIGGSRDFTAELAAGSLRPLAISSRNRRTGIDVPTIKEQGLDVELVNWRGVFAPAKIDAATLKSLAATIETMAKSLAWHDEIARRGWLDLYQPGEAFARFVGNETARIGEVLRRLGVAG